MINQIESINLLLASVATLRTDLWANEKDASDFYSTHYLFPIQDTSGRTKQFAQKAGFIESQNRKISLSKLGQVYLELGSREKGGYRLEPILLHFP